MCAGLSGITTARQLTKLGFDVFAMTNCSKSDETTQDEISPKITPSCKALVCELQLNSGTDQYNKMLIEMGSGLRIVYDRVISVR